MAINYKPLEKNLEEGMSQLGKQIKGSPHIILGDKSSGQPQAGFTSCPGETAQKDIFNPRERALIDKLKKWGIVIAVMIVLGYAAYRVFLG